MIISRMNRFGAELPRFHQVLLAGSLSSALRASATPLSIACTSFLAVAAMNAEAAERTDVHEHGGRNHRPLTL